MASSCGNFVRLSGEPQNQDLLLLARSDLYVSRQSQPTRLPPKTQNEIPHTVLEDMALE